MGRIPANACGAANEGDMQSAETPPGSPVVAITGAGRGIGAATAARFANEGWRVAILDSAAATLEDTARTLGTACVWSGVVDVTDYASLAAAATAIGARTQRIDVLVNNAGVLNVGPFERVSPEECERQIRVNVLGVVNGVHAFFERLRTTPGARIVNLASASSIYGTPDFAVYSASKFAVRGLTEALEIEFRRHDIRVSDISPPFVSGEMLASQTYDAPGIKRMGGIKMAPDEVAGWIWRAATDERRRVHYTLETSQRLLRPLSAIPALTRPVMAWLMGY
jgi:NAD(P)-dependent dehydrogenase (short-subunit alcohol dehydrogenase family)